MALTGILIQARMAAIALPGLLLSACAATPATNSGQAELAACTQQADAAYQANNQDGLARTSQNGLYFAPMPNHVFDAQRDGSEDTRANQIKDCIDNGNADASLPGQAPLPRPQIIGAQNSP